MLYVNDNFYDQEYFEQCNQQFEKDPILNNCQGMRFTVCITDAALWIALCLYTKSKGASVFPLPIDTPKEAAIRRAEKSNSHYLLFGDNIDNNININNSIDDLLSKIETIPKRDVNTDKDTESVLVQMSSGTTGEPKVIERSWNSIDHEIENYVEHFSEAQEMTPIVACPVSHSYGLICGVLVALKRGVTPQLIQNFNPKYIIRKLQEAEKPILYSSPSLIVTITMLIKADAPVHAIMTSGTLMQSTWFSQVANKAVHLYQQYGCSEVGCIALGGEISSVYDVGMPLPHLKVSAGSEENPSEIIITAPNGDSISTRDLGYIDAKNRLHFLSRIDDMINVSGLNVYPTEVEDVALEMPEITDAVVFKRNHGFGNDQVCLQYVSTAELTAESIREWCAKKLAAYQVPISITPVDKIDRLPNGKVNRKQLAESAA